MSVKTKYQCEKCKNMFSAKAGNYKKHIKVCSGSRSTKLKFCKYCSLSFDGLSVSDKANHSKWCIKNPKRSSYAENLINNVNKMNEAKRKSGVTNHFTKAKIENKEIPPHPRKGLSGFKGTPHTEKTKKLLSEKALLSKHRRLLRSIRKYTKKDGTIVMLDSSWEEALAKRLDDMNIEWTRPNEPISYLLLTDGKTHNYFPDFYLPKYNIYLDPKNPIAMKVQKEKIDSLRKSMKNLIIIETYEECVNFKVTSVL